jgi:hypothetical protein
MNRIVQLPRKDSPTDWTKLSFDVFVRTLVADFQSCPRQTHRWIDLHHRFQINRKRFYDVINILIVLGVAGGFTAEEFIWFGEDQILPNLIKQKHTMNIMNLEIPLSVLFHKKTVSVSQL